MTGTAAAALMRRATAGVIVVAGTLAIAALWGIWVLPVLAPTRAAAADLAAPPLAGAAQTRTGAEPREALLALAESVQQVLDNIRNLIVGLLAGLATVFGTIGGARYVMSGGDPGEVERARAALRAAAFGYVLAALAPLVVELLKQIVGA